MAFEIKLNRSVLRLWNGNWIVICAAALLLFFSIGYSLWDWTYWAEITFRDNKVFELKLDKIRILQQFGLIVLGLPALCFALWRSWTAHKQANASLKLAKIAERGQNLDRFNNAAQLLDGTQLSIARAGLYSLTMLGRDAPAEYFELAARLQLGYARDIAPEMPKDKTHAGFVLALEQFSALRASVGELDRSEFKKWNLAGVFVKDERLGFVDLRDCVFAQSEFEDCLFIGLHLANTYFFSVKFKGCRFSKCDFTGAEFDFSELAGVTFHDCNISSTKFTKSKGVTTSALESCWAWSDTPPLLPSGVKSEKLFNPGAQGEAREAYKKMEESKAFGSPRELI